MARDPKAAVLDMVQAIERAGHLSRKLDRDSFLTDETVQWAVFSQIVIIGEAAGRLDDTFQKDNPDIPWSAIIGMRNRLVHGYDSVDWTRVWKTLRDDLPPLLEQLKTLLPFEGGSSET